MQRFSEIGIQVFGLSADTSPSNAAFARQLGLKSFPILSDNVEKETIKAYGVFNSKNKIAYRSYFLIGKDKKIIWSATENKLLENNVVVENIKKALNLN